MGVHVLRVAWANLSCISRCLHSGIVLYFKYLMIYIAFSNLGITKKTEVIHDELNPVWNEVWTPINLRKTCLYLSSAIQADYIIVACLQLLTIMIN